MEKYFKRKSVMSPFLERDESGPEKRNKFDLELSKLPYDPGQRPPISSYNPNCYISKNAAYCLCCYLFRPEIGEQASGETFTKNGFSNWKKPERLEEHVGGLAFRGYDESDNSSNQGNYLRILRFLTDHNEDIKNIVRACSIETTNAIRDVSDALFFVLIDESHDASMKEQMAVVLRYVDKNGSVIERFIGLKHVTRTNAISLKEALDQLFSKHELSISRLCKFNSLKTLIINENKCAYYIYCFAYQLQLAIVAVAKKHDQVNSFFNVVANPVNKQLLSVVEALENDDLPSGSHYGTLLHIISLFPHIISVLEIVAKDKDILALSNELSQALQRKDQDILNAIKLVEICKKNWQIMRDNG
ncbi:TTF-type domain-containing protein [Citrus sinensis]|nr:TTF-type domain-containing protein [Citrus sinensis]